MRGDTPRAVRSAQPVYVGQMRPKYTCRLCINARDNRRNAIFWENACPRGRVFLQRGYTVHLPYTCQRGREYILLMAYVTDNVRFVARTFSRRGCVRFPPRFAGFSL